MQKLSVYIALTLGIILLIQCQSTPNKGSIELLNKGQDIAQSSQKVLGKKLLNALANHGTEGALTFCNANALGLTDSLSKAMNVSIKRVSDKARNPNNKANQTELEYIESAKLQLLNHKEIKAKLIESDESFTGYYPIVTNAMCLQCHGQIDQDIQANTLKTLERIYPNDKATGYQANELRGIWVIEMKK